MRKNYLAHFLKKSFLFLIIFLTVGINSCKKDIVQQQTSINTTYVNPLLNLTEKQKVQQTEIIAYLKKCKDDLTPYLQFNKSQQNVINGKHVIRIPIADDAALFFTKDNDTLKAFIYKWIDRKPGERNFTGGIFSYSFQDNKGRVLKYGNGKLEKWGVITPPAGTASPFVSGIKGGQLKVHLGESDTFLNKIFCWIRGGTWIGFATGCDTQNGWGAGVVNWIVTLLGLDGSGADYSNDLDGNSSSEYTYDNGGNFQGYPGFIVGTGPFGGNGSSGSSGSTGGTTTGGGGSGSTPVYGGGPFYVTKWVSDDNNDGCTTPTESGDMNDPNGVSQPGGPSCSGGSSGHWETYQIDFEQQSPEAMEMNDNDPDDNWWTDNSMDFLAKQALPSYAQMYANYPKTSSGGEVNASEVAHRVGGQVEQLYITNGYVNACALRVSIALNKSGIHIPSITDHTFQGTNGDYYFLSAAKLFHFLMKTFPAPTLDMNSAQGGQSGINYKNAFSGKKGLFMMVPNDTKKTGYNATGHASMFDGTYCVGGESHTPFNVPGGVKRIVLWELN